MATDNVTAARVRELFDYDPGAGVLTWRNRPLSDFKSSSAHGSFTANHAGRPAGGVKRDGYVYVFFDGRSFMAHRLAWIYMTGQWPAAKLDHRNGIGSDNRIANLREATTAENNQNSFLPLPASGARGVCWVPNKRRWRATISINGKVKHLGLHKHVADASAAYEAARLRHHPFSRPDHGASPQAEPAPAAQAAA